jgi:hypothetical protein
MGVLRDSDLVTMVFELMNRGIQRDHLERAMKHMIGPDWRDVNLSIWLKRLRVQGYVLHKDTELTVSDLEALVKGRIALDQLNNHRLDRDM